MEDVNKAKDAVGDKGIVMASLSGTTLDEWEEMVTLVNETSADWVERASEGVYGKVDYKKCIKCCVCKRSRFCDAITLTKCGAVIDQHKCDGCGMRMEVCPANAVSMTSVQRRV